MPIYEFKCKNCDHHFEQFKSISTRHEPLGEPCPSCSTVGEIEQQVSGFAFCYNTAKLPTNTKLREKFQQIHENTPGSRLDQVSSITPI